MFVLKYVDNYVKECDLDDNTSPELNCSLSFFFPVKCCQVFDLSSVKPHEFVQYGLACLTKFASLGDSCAKETREKLRVVVAGGDGTVGWVLGCLGELNKQGRLPVPPAGIIPLGTGNDLSRSFGWELEVEGELSEKVSCYQGVFYNYFSIGMDARVAYGFHHLCNKKPYLAQGPISNKLIYSGYSCTQGWFCTPCTSDPGLRTEFYLSQIFFHTFVLDGCTFVRG
ncbi:Diacylglycerol kinase 4 [Forsythia ovata]|uniref:diacylglycerol kinase (ATP) n=1 Tax=Forsythia ovata TaxID=205694 RepID=A0ABD1S2R5_9LAMI